MKKLLHSKESYKILGACFEVYKQKGSGFTEPVYQECLAYEFALQKIPFREQPKINLDYKGKQLNHYFKPDFICFNKIIIELKALPDLLNNNKAQVINYLKATNLQLALLINFGHFPKLEYKRILNTKNELSIGDELKNWTEKPKEI